MHLMSIDEPKRMNIIPAGYVMKITTWENDADNYRTETLYGLSKTLTAFIVALCKLHRLRHNSGGAYFGNMYEPSDSEIEAYKNAINGLITGQMPLLTEDDKSFMFGDVDDMVGTGYDAEITQFDYLTEFLYDIGICGSEFYTRVFHSCSIEYNPTEIQWEDVTSDFM